MKNKKANLYMYLIALGSNQRHHRHGRPRDILMSVLEILEQDKISIFDHSNIIESPPIGPSKRNYANSVAIIVTSYLPDKLLETLKNIENEYGKRLGQRWSKRCLDIDIILWSEGIWSCANVSIPHPLYHKRSFVLEPAAQIAADWVDPILNLRINQLLFRNSAPKQVDRLVTDL